MAVFTGYHNNGWTRASQRTKSHGNRLILFNQLEADLAGSCVGNNFRPFLCFNNLSLLEVFGASENNQPALALLRENGHPGFQIPPAAPVFRDISTDQVCYQPHGNKVSIKKGQRRHKYLLVEEGANPHDEIRVVNHTGKRNQLKRTFTSEEVVYRRVTSNSDTKLTILYPLLVITGIYIFTAEFRKCCQDIVRSRLNSQHGKGIGVATFDRYHGRHI